MTDPMVGEAETLAPRRQSIELSINDQFRPRTSRAFLEKVVSAALTHLDRMELEVSLLLTDDAEIARIHGEYLGDATPTDVISFPMEGVVEIVVSVERARAVAHEQGHAIRAEIALYVVHGILHACGHDDMAPASRARMRLAETEILTSIGQKVSPVDDGI